MKKTENISRIGIVGAGNVASHLAAALKKNGFSVEQVMNRTEKTGRALADSVGATFSNNMADVDNSLDCLILAVPDRAIREVSERLDGFNGIVLHTSGSVSIDVFDNIKPPYGVLYPLQTFTSGREVDFSRIPVFVEGSGKTVYEKVEEMAGRLTDKVFSMDSNKRAHLHLAAVFACNFSNFLLAKSYDILNNEGIDKEVLNELIKETTSKALDLGPENAQTGPAVRGDDATIKKHLDLLSCYPELKQIYQFLSRSIQDYYSRGRELNEDE